MCAIVDASIKGEILSGSSIDPESAGARFREWLESGRGRVVLGGSKLRNELFGALGKETRWWKELKSAGVAIEVDNQDVDSRSIELAKMSACVSNDAHIIALAQVSQARLLYSNDWALQQDFRNPELVRNPRGRVYSTRESKKFTAAHRGLLENRELCRHG